MEKQAKTPMTPDELKESLDRIVQLIAEAAGVSLQSKQLDPQEERFLYAAAYHAYENGKYEDAINFFRYLTGCAPTNKDYWMGLGAAQQMAKKFQEAIYSYGAAALIHRESPQVHLHAADCFFALGQIENGLQALESAEIAIGKKEEPAIKRHIALMRELWKKPSAK